MPKTRRRQDVQWIEELYGRRQSSDAETVLAVAPEGFTATTQRKAARFGILLRDLRPFSEAEIASWRGQITLMLYYYQYADVRLAIGLGSQSVQNVDPEELSRDLQSHGILQSAFETAAAHLDKLKLLAARDARTYRLKVKIDPEMIELSGEAVREISFECKVRLVEHTIASPEVFGYGEPKQAATQREVRVEQFELGETTIVHGNERIAIDIDLSTVALPPVSQIRYFRVTSADQVDHERVAITNPEKLGVAGPLLVDLYGIQTQ
jgi:hypothetical protein